MNDAPACFVVLGMHRSGTSAITRGLQALGVELGDRLMPGDRYNPAGYWEDADIVDTNGRLMAALGITWHSVALVERSHWESPIVRVLQRATDRGGVSRDFRSKSDTGTPSTRALAVTRTSRLGLSRTERRGQPRLTTAASRMPR
jgi:hypothetical protein